MDKRIIAEIEHFLDLNLDGFIANYIFKDEKNIDEVLKSIQKKFKLKNYPYKIVCLDISHINGKYTSGGLSAMKGALLYKKDYRQFKIPEEFAQDDYKSLKYCINKFFENNNTDLFILDGGKGQLNVIYELDNDILEKIDFISIGKGKARKRKGKLMGEKEYFFTTNGDQIEADYNKFEDKLLLKLRDEAHNFANRYRKKQMQHLIKN